MYTMLEIQKNKYQTQYDVYILLHLLLQENCQQTKRFIPINPQSFHKFKTVIS